MASKKKRLALARFRPTTMTPKLDRDGAAVGASLYPPSSNPCPNCPAKCCTSRIETSLPDVVRFCTTLSLPFHQAFELATGGQKPFELDDGHWILVLRREADGYCRFLGRWGDDLRCGVYPVRPTTCRLYPFAFEHGGVRHAPGVVHCPVPFGMGAEAEARMAAEAARGVAEWAAHDAICAAWKKKKKIKIRSFGAFLAYAIPKAAKAIGVDGDAAKAVMLDGRGCAERNFDMMVEHRVVRSR